MYFYLGEILGIHKNFVAIAARNRKNYWSMKIPKLKLVLYIENIENLKICKNLQDNNIMHIYINPNWLKFIDLFLNPINER